ncbi:MULTISPECIES: helix-turn-helix domain-containing protein [unclassified Picosynechococcus]|nr:MULTISPECIES: helix-turn-helix transcriptional regulator [unclassified Picosynechococcus]ACA99870.1 HTH containing protein [Picosynechococcus sp. PCC 7002]SMH55113.1 Helix-turn-helix [Picosynechococcus sp. OG1]SMQ83148.1 Helix-turn-helix [Synechococcus sp. 7002]
MMKTSKPQQTQATVLKQIRETLSLTQFEFAAKTGISLSTIQRAESGQREPNLSYEQWKKFTSIARQAGFDPEKLPDRLSEKVAI